MITTEAALYGGSTTTGAGVITPIVCGCGQELGSTRRPNCPRCGCCLN